MRRRGGWWSAGKRKVIGAWVRARWPAQRAVEGGDGRRGLSWGQPVARAVEEGGQSRELPKKAVVRVADGQMQASTNARSICIGEWLTGLCLRDLGLCGSFLDATIAKSRQIENTETLNENSATPVNSPESVEYSSDDLDEDYVELDDDFIEKCNVTTDARKIKKLLAEHAYMKDIVTNKRKIPNEEISTMLANYSFNGKIPKKLGDPGAVIDYNKGMVTFNVDDKEHTVYFPKRIDKKGKMKKFKFGELFKKATTSTGRPSRASTQIRRSYNEDVIAPSFAPEEDNGAPNASSFPCYEFLTNAGILDDFFTLVNRAGLATYVGDEREQYYRLTKVFVESFKFHNAQFEPTVAFKIYDIPVTMKLEEFCRALDIAPVGTARRIDDNPRDLLELYRGITEDDCRTIQRGKIRNIQLPAIKYFAYYIATSILGRENTSNISSYHLAFLNVALTGETSYHLGSLIAPV
ncbi:hypothetical protein QYE76_054794 [Lolium multiflorum]|uniref:Arabidopsis retrotransposon Orf1 C-terminal domain-containing protein n=1 Tax=Lolium multiflorum TaxID=4521 RepID=A0AAD8SZE0_LOLMU|nr:hypothetical protein QYE76_054794 [Lolium multiflorum]